MRLKLAIFVIMMTFQMAVIMPVFADRVAYDVPHFMPVDNVNIADLKITDDLDNNLNYQLSGADFYVVNLWATWCAPCVDELPTLQSLREKLIGRGYNIEVIVVSVDRNKDVRAISNFLKKHQIVSLRPFHDAAKNYQKALKPASMPMTYLVDKSGNIVASYNRPAVWDKEEVIQEVISWKDDQ